MGTFHLFPRHFPSEKFLKNYQKFFYQKKLILHGIDVPIRCASISLPLQYVMKNSAEPGAEPTAT